MADEQHGHQEPALRRGLIGVVVVGLVVDAVVHLDLASAFPHNRTSVLSEAEIFRAEATLALLAALAVLARPRRWSAAVAFVIGASAFVAAVVYRYADLGTIGPVPNLYDPYWAPAGKVISVIAEAVAALAAAVLFAREQRMAREGRVAASDHLAGVALSAGRRRR